MTEATNARDKRRCFRGLSVGNDAGLSSMRRIAIAFTPGQIDALNIIAEERDTSFSKTVSDLVDMAIEEILA
jgi:hypothetical protein